MIVEDVIRVRYELEIAGRLAIVGRVSFPADQWAEMGGDERREVVEAVAKGRASVSWEVEAASIDRNAEGGG